MARPHICFIQSQSLSWRPHSWLGHDDVSAKFLSVDDDTGAYTAIFELAPGYQQNGEFAFSADLELFLLTGSVSIDEMDLGLQDYALIPAGVGFSTVHSAGATLLAMPLGSAALTKATKSSRPIVYHDTFSMPWLTGMEGSVTGKPLSGTISTKKLRNDPATGGQTFLYGALAQHPPPKVMPGTFTHPMVEEIFVLAGEFTFGDTGRMGPGGYVWWRENKQHGPVGSEAGYHMLIRVHDGHLKNEFSKQPSPFRYDADYRPDLPAALEDIAQPYPRPPRW